MPVRAAAAVITKAPKKLIANHALRTDALIACMALMNVTSSVCARPTITEHA